MVPYWQVILDRVKEVENEREIWMLLDILRSTSKYQLTFRHDLYDSYNIDPEYARIQVKRGYGEPTIKEYKIKLNDEKFVNTRRKWLAGED